MVCRVSNIAVCGRSRELPVRSDRAALAHSRKRGLGRVGYAVPFQGSRRLNRCGERAKMNETWGRTAVAQCSLRTAKRPVRLTYSPGRTADSPILVASLNHMHSRVCEPLVTGKKQQAFPSEFVLHGLRHTFLPAWRSRYRCIYNHKAGWTPASRCPNGTSNPTLDSCETASSDWKP